MTEAPPRAGPAPMVHGPREVWRRTGDRESGQREVVVLDPDGYLIMAAEPIGERPLSPVTAVISPEASGR